MRTVIRPLFLAVVLITVGAIILPQTVSLFVGQHDWYGIDAAGNQIPCQKCHADVYEELVNSPYHESLECEHCHRGVNITYASDYAGDVYGGNEAHAASTLSCMICHSYKKSANPPWSEAYNHSHREYSCSSDPCHTPSPTFYPPIAGGFGITGQSGDTGTYAAHRKFVLDAKNSSMMESANEACISCHTHVAVKINFTHYGALEFDVNWDTLNNQFRTSNMTVNTSTEVVRVIWGNSSGSGWTSCQGKKWP